MEFRKFVEARGNWQYNSNNVISVDIQPFYEKYFSFKVQDFANFLLEMLQRGRRVVYFYNGEEVGISDDHDDSIKEWLAESLGGTMYDYYDDEDENEDYDPIDCSLFNNIEFHSKGYAFFRSWMDYGVDPGNIQRAVRYMAMNGIWDSREMPEEVLDEFLDGAQVGDHIYIPHISVANLKKMEGCYLCGGGKDACLLEIEILMRAFNINHRLFKKFIY